MFSQAEIKRYNADAHTADEALADGADLTLSSREDMQKALTRETSLRAQQDPTFLEKDDALRAAFAAGKGVLLELQVPEFDIRSSTQLREQLIRHATEASAQSALTNYEAADQERHNALRRARFSAMKTIKQERLAQAQANAKVIGHSSRRSDGGQGSIPLAEKDLMGG